jgi:hypothetical protein
MIELVNKTEVPAQPGQENKNSNQATQAGPGIVGFQGWDGNSLKKIKTRWQV